jgi:hypothetical protein
VRKVPRDNLRQSVHDPVPFCHRWLVEPIGWPVIENDRIGDSPSLGKIASHCLRDTEMMSSTPTNRPLKPGHQTNCPMPQTEMQSEDRVPVVVPIDNRNGTTYSSRK